MALNEFAPENRPPFFLTFISFHSMVALGTFFIVVMLAALIQIRINKLWENKWMLRIILWSIPLPLAACQLGWITAEVGRQPMDCLRSFENCQCTFDNSDSK